MCFGRYEVYRRQWILCSYLDTRESISQRLLGDVLQDALFHGSISYPATAQFALGLNDGFQIGDDFQEPPPG